jgi:hypothetical protein
LADFCSGSDEPFVLLLQQRAIDQPNDQSRQRYYGGNINTADDPGAIKGKPRSQCAVGCFRGAAPLIKTNLQSLSNITQTPKMISLYPYSITLLTSC